MMRPGPFRIARMMLADELDEARIDQRLHRRIDGEMQISPGARHHLPIEKGLLDDELRQPVHRGAARARQKRLRPEMAVDRMVDARQPFRADDAVEHQVDLRLVGHVEPMRLERLGEIDLQDRIGGRGGRRDLAGSGRSFWHRGRSREHCRCRW